MADTGTARTTAPAGPAQRPTGLPGVNPITLADIGAVLVLGLRDLRRAPVCGLADGAFFAGGGLAVYLLAAWAGLVYLAYPLAAGFALVGPFFAIALYEVSNGLETGKPPSLRSVVRVGTGTGARRLGWMPMLNLFAFFIWVDVAAALYLGFFGLRRFDIPELLLEIFTTTDGLIFLVAGNLVGAIFAVLIFATTVVAYPLLLDRDTDFITAIATSWRCVRTNPVAMLTYGAIVGVSTFLAILPALLGLIVVLPVLGHATWHLYRRLVTWPGHASGGEGEVAGGNE